MDDEIVARGLSQKALSLRHNLMEMREPISREQERKRNEVEAQERREREDASRKQHNLLLMQFDDAIQSENPQRRGYLLEDLLARTFGLHGVEVARSYCLARTIAHSQRHYQEARNRIAVINQLLWLPCSLLFLRCGQCDAEAGGLQLFGQLFN